MIILYWVQLAREFLSLVKQIEPDVGASLSGIDLASVYKRKLVGNLDGYPETKQAMFDYWDTSGLTGISNLTENVPNFGLTDEEAMVILNRIRRMINTHKQNKLGKAPYTELKMIYWVNLVKRYIALKPCLTTVMDQKAREVLSEFYVCWDDMTVMLEGYPETEQVFIDQVGVVLPEHIVQRGLAKDKLLERLNYLETNFKIAEFLHNHKGFV